MLRKRKPYIHAKNNLNDILILRLYNSQGMARGNYQEPGQKYNRFTVYASMKKDITF
jgi:hypothetical protein